MKITLIRNLVAMALFGLFTQGAVAQDGAPMAALKEIATIVVSLEHFPTDADKMALAKIAGTEGLPQGVKDMATAVSGIEHAINAEGKAAMARIQANDQAPASAKTLAGLILGFNHMLGADDKMALAGLFD